MLRKFLIVLGIFGLIVAAGFGLRTFRNARIAREATELGKVLEEEIREWEARDRSRPPLFEPAVEGAAWDHYREAWRLHEKLDEDLWKEEDFEETTTALEGWPGPPTPIPECAVRLLRRYDPVLAAIRDGACTRSSGLATDLREGFFTRKSEGAEPRPFSGWLCASRLVEVLRQRGAAALQQDRPEEAVTLWRLLIRLADDLSRGGEGIEGGMGLVVGKMARTDLARLVGGGLLLREQVDRVERIPPPLHPGWCTIDGASLRAQVDLMRIAQGEKDWLPVELLADSWLERLRLSLSADQPGKALDAWQRFRELYPGVMEGRTTADDASVRQASDDIARSSSDATILWKVTADGVRSSFQILLNTRRDARESHEMLRLNLALFRFREREGRDPETIEEIRPEEVRPRTSKGEWDWQQHGVATHRWIGRGTAADRAREKERAEQFVKRIFETE